MNGKLYHFVTTNDIFIIYIALIFALKKYICVIRTYLLSEQVFAPSNPEKRGSSVFPTRFKHAQNALNSQKTVQTRFKMSQ